MNTVLVVLHLVACQPDLLICNDMPDDGRRWTDIGDCQQVRPITESRAKSASGNGLVIMGKCRYLIDRDGRSPLLF